MKTLLVGLLLAVAPAAFAADNPKDFPHPDTPPKPLKQMRPEYPIGLRYAGVVGQVTLDAVLDTAGNVAEVHVARSNNPFFERPAIDAVMKWKFTPAMKAGKPVPVRIRQQINFDLTGVPAQSLWTIMPPRDPTKLPEAYRWDIAPEPVSTLMTTYPFEALLAEKKGKATVRYVIGPDGRIAQARVMEATAPEFGAATLATIDGWRFKPARRKADGAATFAVVTFTREFEPDGRGDVPVSDSARWIVSRLRKNNLNAVKGEELDAPPKPVSQRPPVYPSPLREAGTDGEALIEFYIDQAGDAQLPRIVSATAPEFGYAAAQAVATWRFAPPKKAGKSVIVRAQQLVTFHLKERPLPPPAEVVP
jgi:TonB family protein